MKKISVIIPVYNTERYLRKCLNSIINQEYQNLEIIIVNDGSTDKSEDIIKEYVKENNKIIYLTKENGGLSDCRNYGMKYATGDYICFVDSDDYLDKELFEKLKKYIDLEYDMIKYKLVKVDENYKETEKINGPIFENKSGIEAFNILCDSDVMLQPACLYLYKTSLLKENKFEYPVGKYHEDFARTLLIMLKANKVASTNVFGYYYYQSQTSITRGNEETKKSKRAWDMLDHYDFMIEKIREYNLDKNTEYNLKKYYTNNILIKTNELSKANRQKYIKEIKQRKLIKNIKVKNFKQLIKRMILSININWYLKLRK